MRHDRILVVATTSDYIELLRTAAPGKLLFLTAHAIRRQALEPSPSVDEEVLCDPEAPDIAIHLLKQHLRSHRLELRGMVCFDCESMALAAGIGEVMNLPYPSPQSIGDCRDKSRTAAVWQAHQVPCPRSETVASPAQVTAFFHQAKGACVLKPVDGSGSERVFRCENETDCLRAFAMIHEGPADHGVLMQDFVEGTEYSCDFIVDEDRVELIRMTRKIHEPGAVFGTIMAYELIEFLPENISRAFFLKQLGRAARSLGLTRAICMVDMIVQDGELSFLELAPRPGGDCLPWLIRRSMGLDMLKLAVDFADPASFTWVKPQRFVPYVGVRIHARRAGTLKRIDASTLMKDPRVLDVLIKHGDGHPIALPPDDYDSWNLGHIIFKPLDVIGRFQQCRELLSLLRIEIDHDPSRPRHRAVSTHSDHPRAKALTAAC